MKSQKCIMPNSTSCIWPRVDKITVTLTRFENVEKSVREVFDTAKGTITISSQQENININSPTIINDNSPTIINDNSLEVLEEVDEGDSTEDDNEMPDKDDQIRTEDEGNSTGDNEMPDKDDDTTAKNGTSGKRNFTETLKPGTKVSDKIGKEASDHLRRSKELSRGPLHKRQNFKGSNPSNPYNNDYNYNIDYIKSQPDNSALIAGYKQKIINECKGDQSDIVNTIGFFTTLKCIGDFSQCMEAYKRGCMFMAGDSMQFILGSILGARMIKNHAWDFKYQVGKHYWVSDSLFNYIYKNFSNTGPESQESKLAGKFYEDSNDERQYKFSTVKIKKAELLQTFISNVEKRNYELCNNPITKTYYKDKEILLWFPCFADQRYKIGNNDNNILFDTNKNNINKLLQTLVDPPLFPVSTQASAQPVVPQVVPQVVPPSAKKRK